MLFLSEKLPIILFAPAKVNLSLHLKGQRDDGYHFLESVTAFCDFADKITLKRLDHTDMNPKQQNDIQFATLCDEITFIGEFSNQLQAEDDFTNQNSVAKILQLLRQYLAQKNIEIPPLNIIIDKKIPPQAGLGGGSADAAALLRWFQEIFPQFELSQLASQIGGDGLACLYSKLGLMQGIGNQFTVLPTNSIKNHSIFLLSPGIGLSTAQVYQQINMNFPEERINFFADTETLSSNALTVFLQNARNDLQASAEKLLPIISEILHLLRSEGKKINSFQFARMSGSGSVCFAFFNTPEGAEQFHQAITAQLPKKFWCRSTQLQ